MLLFRDAYNWGGVEAQLTQQLTDSLAADAADVPDFDVLQEDDSLEPVVR